METGIAKAAAREDQKRKAALVSGLEVVTSMTPI
jgi:hypothetical protein